MRGVRIKTFLVAIAIYSTNTYLIFTVISRSYTGWEFFFTRSITHRFRFRFRRFNFLQELLLLNARGAPSPSTLASGCALGHWAASRLTLAV
jgi:hypothetical protein